jgi:hypothetical protein
MPADAERVHDATATAAKREVFIEISEEWDVERGTRFEGTGNERSGLDSG